MDELLELLLVAVVAVLFIGIGIVAAAGLAEWVVRAVTP